MPDEAGNIRGIALSLSEERWKAIFGPREYTEEQYKFMDEAVKNRKPLSVEPLPIED